MAVVRACWATALIAAALAVSAIGCVGYREPLADDAINPPTTPPELATIDLYLRRPQLDDPIPTQFAGLAAEDVLEFRTTLAERALASLQPLELFHSVTLVDAPPEPRGVYAEVVEAPPAGRYCDGDDILGPFLTLGILPAQCTRDSGVYLHFLNSRLPDFACSWPQTEMVGLWPVFLPRYTRQPQVEAYSNNLRRCVASRWEAFVAASKR